MPVKSLPPVSPVSEVHGLPGTGAGRHLVASCSLSSGQLVLRETALLVGPRLSCLLVCVECLTRMDQLVTCPRCGFPLCLACKSLEHKLTYHSPECDLLKINGVKMNLVTKSEAKILLSMVSVLRLLLMEGWRHLESHSDLRKNTKQWRFHQKHIVPVIQNLTDVDEKPLFTKDMIDHAAGVLDTNSFEIKNKDKRGTTKTFGRCLFVKAALFNNSCEPNCYRRLNDKTIEIFTTRSVFVGEELSICYADLLQPTHMRQAIFTTTKYFQCQCARCRDPTEKGSFLTSLKCEDCGSAVVQSSCENCAKILSKDAHLYIHEKCDQLVRRLDWRNCWEIVDVMGKLREVLTTHHHILVLFKRTFLVHAGKCGNCRSSPEYKSSYNEMTDLINMFLPGHVIDWNIGQQVK